MFSFNNYDHQEALRQRFRQASRSFKRILTPARRGSGDQGASRVHRRHYVIHHDSEVQENQGARVGVSESAQRESESAVQDQHLLLLRIMNFKNRRVSGDHGSGHASVRQCH